ncbi:hypothetical protein [Bittarella sp. HCP28S3_D9]|uniref:hypothetical protein n=1 Tax=Bittarella sp. HCP28S3_D9 TaxID=3440253 RepID=UPI003F88F876
MEKMKKFGFKKVFSGLLAFAMVLTVSAVALAQVQPRSFSTYTAYKATSGEQVKKDYLNPNDNLEVYSECTGQGSSPSGRLMFVYVDGFNYLEPIYTRYLGVGQVGKFPPQGVRTDAYRLCLLDYNVGYGTIASW